MTDKPNPAARAYPAAPLTPKQVQQNLKDAGLYEGKIDGKVGPVTQEAAQQIKLPPAEEDGNS